jgi:outer membrane receptor protein involved in Fe transport
MAGGSAALILCAVLGQAQTQAQTDPAEQVAQQAPPTPAPASSGSSDQIEEVVVSARLRAEAATESPVVVNALSAEAMEQNGVADFLHLEDQVPNLNISTGFNNDAIHVRGVGTTPNTNAGFEQQVGLFIDGAYYPNGHWLNDAFVDLQQVNVLEGPQGVYLGKNTIAGAIQISTKDPSNVFEGYVKSGYEFYAQERYVEAAVSVPLDDTLAIRFATRWSGQEGYMTNPITGGSGPNYRDNFERVTVAWKPNPDFDDTLKLSAGNYRDTGAGYTFVILGCGGPNNTPAVLGTYGPPGGSADCARTFSTSQGLTDPEDGRHDYDDIISYTATNTLRWRQDYGELTSISAWQGYVYRWLDDQCCTQPNGYGQVPAEIGSSNSALAEDVHYQTKFDFPVNALIGLYYQRTDFHTDAHFSIAPPVVNGLGVPQQWTDGNLTTGPGSSKAAYGEIQWHLTSTLEFDVGGRYSIEHQGFSITTTDVSTLFGPTLHVFALPHQGVNDEQTSYNFSPQATLTWRPANDIMAYVAYKTGFLAGGYSRVGGQNYGEAGSGYGFGPEKVQGGEVGTKFYLDDRKVQLNIAAYYYDYTGLQVNNYNPATTNFTVVNAGEAVDKGIEINGQWRIGDGFNLAGDVAYNDSYYAQFIGSCLSTDPTPARGCNVPVAGAPGVHEENFTGQHTDFAPLWAGHVQLQKVADLWDDWVLRSAVGMTITDKYTIAQFPIQPGYVKLNANVSFESGPMSFALIGQNLNNQFVCTSAYGRTLGAPSEIMCQADRGREVRIEATYRFGGEPSASAPAAAVPPPPPAPATPLPAPAQEAARSFQVFFDFDKSDISAAAAKVIQAAADVVKAGHVVQITVTGHTDTVGSASYNQGLSERRAMAVKAGLVADGVASGEISTAGVGKTGLLVPTADGVREPQNRRAEIMLR